MKYLCRCEIKLLGFQLKLFAIIITGIMNDNINTGIFITGIILVLL